MSPAVEVVEVLLWGRRIGAAAWDAAAGAASFEYDHDFQRSGIELAPLHMPLGPRIYRFPRLARETFHGLPGLLADSLPDTFGNALIEAWLARQGRDAASFSPIERLSYVGTRGMGALEYRPALRGEERSVELELAELVALADAVLRERERFAATLGDGDAEREEALNDILRVGTSAGGARAKAVVAWNRATGELRSGQVAAPAGFEPWLLKFDGVLNSEHGLQDPGGYGRIEYAYSLLAGDAGLAMSPCHLLEESGRAHFMTRRFDRGPGGEKLHMQTLCALGHYDYNQPGAHGYEQALTIAQGLGLAKPELEQLYRRMLFNVLYRNQDDHTKNIAFLMDKRGAWSLAPAFDVNYAYNPSGLWTGAHQMTIAGKRDGFTREELVGVARAFGLKRGPEVLDEVAAAGARWSAHAHAAGVPEERAARLAATFRLELAAR